MTLTPKRANYAENRAKGMTRRQSAITAGLVPGNYIEAVPEVKYELARIRAAMALEADVTKMDVVKMLMDAAEMAKLMSDPQAMVAAAREIGKILGHYAPEVKLIKRGMDQGEVKKALENMTDEELIKLANGKIRVIDGESSRVEVRTDGDVRPVPPEEVTETLLQGEPDVP